MTKHLWCLEIGVAVLIHSHYDSAFFKDCVLIISHAHSVNRHANASTKTTHALQYLVCYANDIFVQCILLQRGIYLPFVLQGTGCFYAFQLLYTYVQ